MPLTVVAYARQRQKGSAVIRSEPITRLEVAACPTHRMDVKHYASHAVGCDCLSDVRREELNVRLAAARQEGNPLAEMAE